MRFHQHVYGRVSQGYQNRSEGYQLAALTDSLASHTELLERLNRLSFFNFRGGVGGEVRFSFFQPVEGYLAFGCSCLARDLSGSTGSFAHHLICERETFLESSLSPIAMLQSFPFFQNESQLPPNRSLPPAFLEVQPLDPPAHEWRAFGLQLVDLFLGPSPGTTPMVILAEQETWAVLTAVFDALPRLEASRFSFSTLFARATDFTPWFRVVFVPDQALLPPDNYIYRAITPQGFQVAAPKQTPLTDIWREESKAGLNFLRLSHIERHESQAVAEVGPLLSSLLPLGPLFRNGVESLEIDILPDLLGDANMFVQYWRAGQPIPYASLRAALWENPDNRLMPFLQAVTELKQGHLRDHALEELAERSAREVVGMHLIEALPEADLNRFYHCAATTAPISVLTQLAQTLRRRDFYANELHSAIVRRALDLVTQKNGDGLLELGRWMGDEAPQFPANDLFRTVAHLLEWTNHGKTIRFQLRNYPVTEREYLLLLPGAWTTGHRVLTGPELLQALYREDYKRTFFSFLSDMFVRCDLNTQEQLLSGCARVCGPLAALDEAMLRAIQQSSEPARLARFYRELLTKLYPKEATSFARLQSIGQPTKKGLFRW